MKKQPSRSAFINFRILIAFTLCLAGFSLAVTAFGAWPTLSAAAWLASQKQAAYEAKLNAKGSALSGRSMAMKSNSRGGTASAAQNVAI